MPKGGKRLLLNLSKSTGEGSQPSVDYLRRKDTSYKDTIVLVDAATEKARQFLEPIIHATPSAAFSTQHNLRQNKMYMLCLVDPAQLEDAPKGDGVSGQARELKFPCWHIPFLRRLLERHQIEAPEEVERKIEAQRTDGWWSRNESELYSELKSLLISGELNGEIERRGKEKPPGPADKLFKGDELLSSMVLYVATFFPNLTPHEFNRLVPLLLSRASRAADDAAEESKDGASESAAAQRGKAALQDWRNSPDEILKKCSLVTVPLRGSTKGVSFSNHNIPDSLRVHLDKKYNFFLENRFHDVQELGLIFSPSTDISKGAVQLSVEMAASYPEYYGSRRLAWMVAEFESSLADGAEARATSWPFIEETNAEKARKRFYQNMSELVRAMLGRDTPLSEVVEEFLQQLLFLKHRRAVLEIVRRLEFAPAFDQFKWLKQLFDSGDDKTRAQTVGYLRGRLRRTGGRVYQVLSSFESWLPEGDRQVKRYSAAWHALNMLLFYFSETALRFAPRYYGSWPSAFPLFDFQDADATAGNLRLLVRLLFHPEMKVALREHRNNQVKGLISVNTTLTNWFFILQGKGEEGAPGRDNGAGATETQFDAKAVGDLLLEQVARNLGQPQQDGLLLHWRERSRELLKYLNEKPYGDPEWHGLAWRRDLIKELIAKFERLRGGADGSG